VKQRRDEHSYRVTPEIIAFHAAEARRLRLRAYRKAARMLLLHLAKIFGTIRR
jgi:hypothetical protein